MVKWARGCHFFVNKCWSHLKSDKVIGAGNQPLKLISIPFNRSSFQAFGPSAKGSLYFSRGTFPILNPGILLSTKPPKALGKQRSVFEDNDG